MDDQRLAHLVMAVNGLTNRLMALEQFLIVGFAGSVRAGAATPEQVGTIFDVVVAGLRSAHYQGTHGAEAMDKSRSDDVIAYVQQLRRVVESTCEAPVKQ